MRQTCEVEGCDQYRVGQGLCRKHYMRLRRKGSTDDQRKNGGRVCIVEGCGKPRHGDELCVNHYNQRFQKAQRLEAKLLDPNVCAYCGETVDPEYRKRNAVAYCSPRHKQLAYTVDGRNAAVARKSYFKRRYGLTIEQVEEMAVGGCAICGTTEWPGRHNRPHVDHDHKTGRIRGILCSDCNTGLGQFKDDPARLLAAAEYLTKG